MTPDFRIRANGEDITEIVRARLVGLTITDALDEESDTCELTIDERPGIALPSTGAEFEVDLGYLESGLAFMGGYTVAEIERTGPPDVLTARGAAADLIGGLKAPRTRSWDFPTIGSLVAEIAAEHGLTPQVEPSLRGVVLPHIDQVAESDLNLLRRLADQQVDVVAKPANGRLLFVRRQALAAAEPQRGPAIRIVRTETVQHRLTRADRSENAAVTGAVARRLDRGAADRHRRRGRRGGLRAAAALPRRGQRPQRRRDQAPRAATRHWDRRGNASSRPSWAGC